MSGLVLLWGKSMWQGRVGQRSVFATYICVEEQNMTRYRRKKMVSQLTIQPDTASTSMPQPTSTCLGISSFAKVWLERDYSYKQWLQCRRYLQQAVATNLGRRVCDGGGFRQIYPPVSVLGSIYILLCHQSKKREYLKHERGSLISSALMSVRRRLVNREENEESVHTYEKGSKLHTFRQAK